MADKKEIRVTTSLSPLEYYTVPADSVPRGLFMVHLEGVGKILVPPEILFSLPQSQTHHHPEFPEDLRIVLRRLEKVFAEVHPLTAESWEDSFRKERRPWNEMAIWQGWADTLEQFTASIPNQDEVSRQKRHDIWEAILYLQSYDARLEPIGSVTRNLLRQIKDKLTSTAAMLLQNERREQYRRLLQPPGLAGPSCISFASLLGEHSLDADFHPIDLLGSADIIFAVDAKTKQEKVIFGLEQLERIAESGVSEKGTALWVELDQSTDEVMELMAAVTFAKGDPYDLLAD